MNNVVIIGAGPAGLAAAIACRQYELNVIVIDEFMQPGGRLLGQLHQEPDGEWWNGQIEARNMVNQALETGVDLRLGLSVHHVEKLETGYRLYLQDTELLAENLLIATGAAESPAPIPGWTLPGVMSIGAAQVMTNVHRVSVGQKGIIIGVNVLSAAIARELQLAGIQLVGMALPASNHITKNEAHPQKVMESLARVAHLAPSAFIRLGSKFAGTAWARNLALHFYPQNGVKMWDIPIHLRKAIVQINGEKQVESVTICNLTVEGQIIKGSEEIVEVDFVCIAGGLYPLVELAAVAGCPFHYVEELGGHIPLHNEQMETPLEGLFVAGNITGIESAKVARAQGKLAGLTMAKRKRTQLRELDGQIQEAIEEVKRTRREATIQFHPRIEEGRQKISQAFQESQKIPKL